MWGFHLCQVFHILYLSCFVPEDLYLKQDILTLSVSPPHTYLIHIVVWGGATWWTCFPDMLERMRAFGCLFVFRNKHFLKNWRGDFWLCSLDYRMDLMLLWPLCVELFFASGSPSSQRPSHWFVYSFVGSYCCSGSSHCSKVHLGKTHFGFVLTIYRSFSVIDTNWST